MILDQRAGVWSGLRAPCGDYSEPIIYRYRGRWFFVLVYAGSAVLSEPSHPYHGPFPSFDAALLAADF